MDTPTGNESVEPGHRTRAPWAWATAAWTLPYVVSKVVYALSGRLGVTGGPEVEAASYADYGPGEVAAAQWANAGVGVAVLALFVLCALPFAARLPRWPLAVPVGLFTVVAVAGAVGMTGRAVFTDSGGALFGGYCAVWAVLAAVVLRRLLRRGS
ncbi:hypothetical protein [Nocardiopsis listeri]|uniref:hypothetical protein n=1 Tax=Nocardiopsis listeri TaxID=53440 RepID=UPI00082AB0BC|nr:hypothetical protein [Nocardiopsis listeri]